MESVKHSASNTLEVLGVGVEVDGRALLQGVNFILKPGEVVSVLGPNGAGKSTLMKVISGERKPTTGQVLLNGRTDWPLNHQALMLGVLPQSSSLSFPSPPKKWFCWGGYRAAAITKRTGPLSGQHWRKSMVCT